MGKWGDGVCMGKERGKWWERGLVAGGRVAVGRGWQHVRRKGEVMGKWGKKRREKERKGKWVGLLHWASVWANK